MRNSSKIILFSVLFFITCCNPIIINSEKLSTTYSETSYGKYLSASYSVRKGDIKNASKILSNGYDFNETNLIELTFYTKIINGQFSEAEKLRLSHHSILDKNSLSNLPMIAINLKGNKLEEALEKISISDDLPGFKMVHQKIKNILIAKANYSNSSDLTEQMKLEDVYDLIIFEKFSSNLKMKNIYNQNRSDIGKLLFLGYLHRNKKFNNFELSKKLMPFGYNETFIKNNFNKQKNLFNKLPESRFIVSAYLIDLANHLKQKRNIPISYIKMLLELSHFISPKLNLANYYLAEIYEKEKHNDIAIEKLTYIKSESLIYLPSLIRKYKISKNLDTNEYKLYLKELESSYSDHISVKFELANNLRKNNKCLEAIKIYDQILIERPTETNVLFFKASCLEKSGKWNEAKKLFLDIIKLDKNDAYSLNYLSYSMAIRNENLNKALSLIQTALKIEPNNGFFLDTLGWIQFKNKQYDLAIANLQRAITIQPNSSEIMDHLGDSYQKKGRIREAIFEWKRALQYDASDKLKKKIKLKLNIYDKD